MKIKLPFSALLCPPLWVLTFGYDSATGGIRQGAVCLGIVIATEIAVRTTSDGVESTHDASRTRRIGRSVKVIKVFTEILQQQHEIAAASEVELHVPIRDVVFNTSTTRTTYSTSIT